MARGIKLKDKNGNVCYPIPYWPIGSIYLTVSGDDPSVWFGGTWEKISGGYLYGCVSSIGNNLLKTTNTGSYSGTSGSTTLTIDQMPSHTHYLTTDGIQSSSKGGDLSTYADEHLAYYSTSAGSDLPYSLRSLHYGSGGKYGQSWGTGGSKGHTHSIPSHSHSIGYIGVWVWKRVA